MVVKRKLGRPQIWPGETKLEREMARYRAVSAAYQRLRALAAHCDMTPEEYLAALELVADQR
jgi:hypothetical protein